jgi:hypothetical protein
MPAFAGMTVGTTPGVRHSRESGNPYAGMVEMPACAGMTALT